jgi:hypothetical protein
MRRAQPLLFFFFASRHADGSSLKGEISSHQPSCSMGMYRATAKTRFDVLELTGTISAVGWSDNTRSSTT